MGRLRICFESVSQASAGPGRKSAKLVNYVTCIIKFHLSDDLLSKIGIFDVCHCLRKIQQLIWATVGKQPKKVLNSKFMGSTKTTYTYLKRERGITVEQSRRIFKATDIVIPVQVRCVKSVKVN